MSNEPVSRYHAEVKTKWGIEEIRVNVFQNSMPDLFADVATVLDYFQGGAKPLKTLAQLKHENGNPTPKPTSNPTPNPTPKPTSKPDLKVPICSNCGTAEFMELIKFNDKKTGQPRQAWKCQGCDQWYWPNKNGNGH